MRLPNVFIYTFWVQTGAHFLAVLAVAAFPIWRLCAKLRNGNTMPNHSPIV